MKSSILRPLVLVLPEAAAPCAKGLRQILCEEIDVAPSDLLDMQATADVQTLMMQPYRRIIVLHITIIIGGFLMMALKSPFIVARTRIESRPQPWSSTICLSSCQTSFPFSSLNGFIFPPLLAF